MAYKAPDMPPPSYPPQDAGPYYPPQQGGPGGYGMVPPDLDGDSREGGSDGDIDEGAGATT